MTDFTKGNATRQILIFTLPMLIGNVFQQVYNMVDAMVVGRYVSGDALASVGTAGVILNFMLAVMAGLTTGASVLLAQFFGAKQQDNVKRTVSTSFIFLAVLQLVVSVGGFLIIPAFLRLMSVPADIFGDTVLYLRIMLAGMIFPMIYNVYVAYLRALGDTKRPLYILIFSTVLNLGLDLLFVLRFRLGVAGVAYATIVAQALAALCIYLYVRRYMQILRVDKLVFDRSLFGPLLRYSIPSAIQLSMTSLASLTIVRLVNSFGSVILAGYTAATKLDQFAMMPLSNVSMAISTFCAQNMGAGREDRARQGLRSGLIIMCGMSVGLSGLLLLCGRWLVSQFVDAAAVDAVSIVSAGNSYLMVLACFYLLFAVFFAFNGFFRGVGDAVIVMALTITSLTIRALSSYALNYFTGMGVASIAWSIPIGWGLCGAFCVYYYKARKWAGKAAVRRHTA